MTATPARLTPGAHEDARAGEDPAAKPVRRRFTDACKLAMERRNPKHSCCRLPRP